MHKTKENNPRQYTSLQFLFQRNYGIQYEIVYAENNVITLIYTALKNEFILTLIQLFRTNVL